MKLELFHYVHCPFCVRVRMALGYLQLPWQSHVLSYDDEATPLALTGVKMLPILKIDGVAMNESLDIIRRLDHKNKLNNDSWGNSDLQLNEIGSLVHNLGMPYWVWSPEFTPAARDYFIKKKSVKRGPFPALARRRSEFEGPLLTMLDKLSAEFKPYWNSDKLTIRDIGLAAHVWGMFSVPEFRFSQKWYDYLMRVKNECHFNYHQDFWSEK